MRLMITHYHLSAFNRCRLRRSPRSGTCRGYGRPDRTGNVLVIVCSVQWPSEGRQKHDGIVLQSVRSFKPLKDRAFAAHCGPRNSNRGWIEWVVRLKCGATAWTARPRLLSTHSRVAPRAVYSTRFAALAIRGPPILRPTRLMFSQPMSLLVSHNLVLSGRVKNVNRHLLRFLTLMFNNKVKTDQYIFHLLFLRPR